SAAPQRVVPLDLGVAWEPRQYQATASTRTGCARCLWAGEILDSQWIAALETGNRVHPRHDPTHFTTLRHFVLPLKEKVVEVLSWTLPRVERADP
ncbi:MAG TPA: hypothetical protein VGL99_14960, partial [Chloroflexota bacterium]